MNDITAPQTATEEALIAALVRLIELCEASGIDFDLVVTAQQVRSYKPDLAHFRKFAEMTGATPGNWIHVANSWVHDVLPAGRMGLRSVWVDRDHTGHPAKFAERRVTSMRRLPETVADVSVLPAWPVP